MKAVFDFDQLSGNSQSITGATDGTFQVVFNVERFADFLRAGLPLIVLLGAVTVALTPVVFPFVAR